ncbi:MAG TPA: DUF86 domain-containing protein [archaeon]|nr:DUF86 domain-containing protein [archaeon]
MNKDPLVFLNHITESIGKIESFSNNLSKQEFLKDELRQSAIIRQLEVIGEAVKNLPIDFINRYPSVPWGNIAGLRNKLIHHYFGVDLNLTFDVVKTKIPELKTEIKKILSEFESEKNPE